MFILPLSQPNANLPACRGKQIQKRKTQYADRSVRELGTSDHQFANSEPTLLRQPTEKTQTSLVVDSRNSEHRRDGWPLSNRMLGVPYRNVGWTSLGAAGASSSSGTFQNVAIICGSSAISAHISSGCFFPLSSTIDAARCK